MKIKEIYRNNANVLKSVLKPVIDSMDMEEPTGAQMIPPPAVKTMVTTKLTEWVPIKEAANEHLTNQDTLKFIERMKEELMEPPSDWDQFL